MKNISRWKKIIVILICTVTFFYSSNVSLASEIGEKGEHNEKRYIKVDQNSIVLSSKIIHQNEMIYISFKLQDNTYVFDGESMLMFQYGSNENHILYFPIHYDAATKTYYGMNWFGGWLEAEQEAEAQIILLSLWNESASDHFSISHSEEVKPPYDYKNGYQNLNAFNFLYSLSVYPFDDIHGGEWYQNAVDYVNYNRIMTGMGSRIFGPANNVARAQFAVILHRRNNEPEVIYNNKYGDVLDGQWYTKAIMWASNTGIVNGYADSGLFGTGDNINREQMAVMMYRYAEFEGYDTSQKADFSNFRDAGSVNEFAKEAMQWAIGTGIISGTDNGTRINPQGNANRAECATILMRFMEKYS